jgi:hypothetical protein
MGKDSPVAPIVPPKIIIAAEADARAVTAPPSKINPTIKDPKLTNKNTTVKISISNLQNLYIIYIRRF